MGISEATGETWVDCMLPHLLGSYPSDHPTFANRCYIALELRNISTLVRKSPLRNTCRRFGQRRFAENSTPKRLVAREIWDISLDTTKNHNVIHCGSHCDFEQLQPHVVTSSSLDTRNCTILNMKILIPRGHSAEKSQYFEEDMPCNTRLKLS